MKDLSNLIDNMENQQINYRPQTRGKFIFVNSEKFYIRGVTYGTFKPDADGIQFPNIQEVNNDFQQMSLENINAVRTYTVPPKYLLDAALANGLKVMVGLPWVQHIAFLDDPERKKSIVERIRQYTLDCAGHPAILCYTIGNEIPAPIVRYYGHKKIESFLRELYDTVKLVDPDGLVTYVNYPTTEYLKLPFLDFDCFNVYLETKEKLNDYLQRLHNLTGDRPLVLAEIGLDSMRNGTDNQAQILDWQLRTIFAKGCAGAFVFAWTDQWWRGGFDIEDWDFGLVDRQRHPKPALQAVSKAFAELPFSGGEKELPLISVLICSRNGGATIRDTMEALLKVDYPRFEVIVVNDGSTDNLPAIVSEYPFRLISTPNMGLSSARNTAMLEAKGEIVAYLDDDAYPDPQWLRYLAYAYLTTSHAGIGGPNIAPDDDGPIATCVANAPGGPIHVLLTDEIAEHIPGCNMSFRKNVLLEIGGFDPVYRTAGDDVDICWRIQHTGRTIGFHPAAFVWHHRRNSVKAYWKQQKGYGKAEALLEAKWPEKYNGFGHFSWTGRIYGNGITLPIKFKKDKIFHGIWGSAPFQSIYQQAPGFINYIPLMPEWYLLIAVLAFFALLGISWNPLLWVLPLLIFAVIVIFTQAGSSAAKSLATKKFRSDFQYLKFWSLTTMLHVIQPAARLYGRIAHGLTPWRVRGSGLYGLNTLFLYKVSHTYWSEKWKSNVDWLTEIEYNLIQSRARVRRGGNLDQWDLQVSCGFFSSCRGLLTVEEHGAGKQLLRFDCHTHYLKSGIVLSFLFALLAILAAMDSSFIASCILGLIAMILAVSYFTSRARGMHDLSNAFSSLSSAEQKTVNEPKLINKKLGDVPKEEPLSISVLMVKNATRKLSYFLQDTRQNRVLESAHKNES